MMALFLLAILVSAGSSVAQDPIVDPPHAFGEVGVGAAGDLPGETPGSDEIPEALRSPTVDFFASGPTLQAHRLRGLKAEVAGLILGDPSGGDIAFEALATPLRAPGDKAYVPLFVEIDGPVFLESNQREVARVEVYAYALGADQQVVSFLAEVFAVNVRELGEAVWQSGLKYYGHLDLPPGDYQLRILVRNYHSGAVALREIKLAVPAFDRLEQPFLLPIFQPPPTRDAWLPVREWQSPSRYPIWIGERAISPVVRPVMVAGRRSEAHILAYGLPTGVVRGRIELLNAGAAVGSADFVEVATREPGEAGKLETIAVSFDSPQVPPGVYLLRVELNGAASAPTPVVVLQPDTRDRALLWTDLRGQLGGGTKARKEVAAAPQVADQKNTRRTKREQRQIRTLASSYRQALLLLGQDHASEARSALLDLESSVLTEGTMEALKSAQLTVAEQLSDDDVESLIPVLALHDELYSTYRRRSLHSLGFHAREMIELLAELYARRGETRGSHIVAARVLASLGGHLQAANLPSSSRRLYRRALGHDPHNLAALLGLATSYERYGDYARSVEVLEDLVAAHSGSSEGLLRLAINLDRLGIRTRVRKLIEQVIELDGPDWVRSLAYQKLSRILVGTGGLEDAAQLLEKSLEEIPQQHGSVYLLAHVYDRQKLPYRSLELLQPLLVSSRESGEASSSASARKLYDSWPETTLDAIRRELANAAAMRTALIAQILDRTPETR